MASQIIEPTSQGNYDQWGQDGGGTKWDALTDSNDATRLKTQTTNHRTSFVYENLTIVSGSEIVSVKSNLRAENGGGSGTLSAMARLAAADAESATETLAIGYQDFLTAVIPRPGGGTWVIADVDNSEFGLFANNVPGGPTTHRVSEQNIEVSYSPPPGAWACMLGILGPVLGANLLLAQMPDLIATFNHATRGKHLIHSHEAVEMYKDLRADPHRRYLI